VELEEELLDTECGLRRDHTRQLSLRGLALRPNISARRTPATSTCTCEPSAGVRTPSLELEVDVDARSEPDWESDLCPDDDDEVEDSVSSDTPGVELLELVNRGVPGMADETASGERKTFSFEKRKALRNEVLPIPLMLGVFLRRTPPAGDGDGARAGWRSNLGESTLLLLARPFGDSSSADTGDWDRGEAFRSGEGRLSTSYDLCFWFLRPLSGDGTFNKCFDGPADDSVPNPLPARDPVPRPSISEGSTRAGEDADERLEARRGVESRMSHVPASARKRYALRAAASFEPGKLG
jgi:hypothetical protein